MDLAQSVMYAENFSRKKGEIRLRMVFVRWTKFGNNVYSEVELVFFSLSESWELYGFLEWDWEELIGEVVVKRFFRWFISHFYAVR